MLKKKKRKTFDPTRFESAPAPMVDATSGELVAMKPLNGDRPLPLLVEARVPDVDLAVWLRDNRDIARQRLNESGALLFRGFGIDSADLLEAVAGSVCSRLIDDNGEHIPVTSGAKVATPVFYAPENKLLWHNENSFNDPWPMMIFFACARPADRGGETPLVDSRELYSRVDPSISRRFEEKGIMYMRNYGQEVGLDWTTVFQTEDRREVDARCRSTGAMPEWKEDGQLRTRAVRPAVIQHPLTGESTWFNQAQHWHLSCLEPEVRETLQASFREEDLPRNCYYGDGSTIEDSVMKEILGLYEELEVVYPWQQGDVVMVDNVLAAHARNPYQGERKILVALGDPTHFAAVAPAQQ